jgi:hypothetical protein
MSKPRGCGKRPYPSREAAFEAMLERPNIDSAGVYRCHLRGCGGRFWHVTSRMRPRKGRRSRRGS